MVRSLLARLHQDMSMSDSPLVTYIQNELDISHRVPVVRRDLVLRQFFIIGESKEVVNSLINQLVSGHYIR